MTAISTAANDDGAGSKLLGLEVIRFICAMAVLVWHYQHFAMVGDGSAMAQAREPLAMLLWPLYRFGHYGVQIFWCISGFIFTLKYAGAISEWRIAPGRFFWLRFSRLYPLHLVTLLLVAALQPAYIALAGRPFVYADFSASSFLLQLAIADQWFGLRAMSFNGPIWSVSAEVFIYAAFFLLVRSFGMARWLIASAIAIALLSQWSGVPSPALICGGFFFAGGAAAVWLQQARTSEQQAELRRAQVAIIISILAVAIYFNLGNDPRIVGTLIMACCPPVLLIAARDWRLLEKAPALIQAAGNLTYSIYLIHFPMQLGTAVVALAAGLSLPVGEPWFLLAYLASTIILGRLVFMRFEAPMQRWIRAATLGPSRERVTA